MRKIISFVLTTVSLAAPLKATLPNVAELLEKFDVPGTSIAVIHNGETVYSKGFGTKEVGALNPVTTQTLFGIASCTKAFTAHIVQKLEEEGLLRLDDPVIQYLPELNLSPNATIRDLISHQSGIDRHDPVWIFREINSNNLIDIVNNLPLAGAPKKQYVYNNLTYGILGLIIEKVSGRSWEEHLNELLLSLEMHNTSTTFSGDYAYPYANLVRIPFREMHAIKPAGAIVSNSDDMAKWVKYQLTLPHSQEVAFTVTTIENALSTGYGLGWFIAKYRDADWIHHKGTIDGYSSEVSLLPEHNLGLVILTNCSSNGGSFTSTVRNQIFDFFLDKEDTDWVQHEIDKKAPIKFAIACADDLISKLPKANVKGTFYHPGYGLFTLNGDEAEYYGAHFPLTYVTEYTLIAKIPVLSYFGAPPYIEIKLKREDNEITEIEVPFEAFRKAKPILFKACPSIAP